MSTDIIVISSSGSEDEGIEESGVQVTAAKKLKLDDNEDDVECLDEEISMTEQKYEVEDCVKIFDPALSPFKRRPDVHAAKCDDFLHGSKSTPVYCRSSKMLPTTKYINIVLDPELDNSKICSQVPCNVASNALFIVDLNSLESPKDVYCDDMGSWIWIGSYKRWCTIDDDSVVHIVGKEPPTSSRFPYYRIKKIYYKNKSSPDVKKIHVFLEDSDEENLNLALIQYLFTEGEHEVTAAPHGNAKSGESYMRTMPSVLSKLKSASSTMTAKRALSFVATGAGGIMHATSAGSLPRNRQQVKDMRRKSEMKEQDALYALMMMCKESEGKRNQDAFVRLVNAAPFPMMVLSFDWTLDDLVRFCTEPTKFSILGVDPTFSLGEFEVTVTTYQHLMLRRKDDDTKTPTMIGPLFVHLKKDFEAYHFFASALVSKRPQLVNLQSFGSDGEAALVNAFCTVFNKAIHLRCFLHFKGNIEEQLQNRHIGRCVASSILHDIFGNPAQLELGLVDAESESALDAMISGLKDVWNEREAQFHNPPSFHAWFKMHSRDVIATTMLRPLRESAGLGSPPQAYYTNAIESKNNILKQQVQYKASQLPTFVEHMKSLLGEQRMEIERAVATSGEYRIHPLYSQFCFSSQKWFKMTEDQRKKKMGNFFHSTLSPCSVGSNMVSNPSQALQSPLEELNLPQHMATTILSRAQTLVSDGDGMVPAPGYEDAWIIKSLSGSKPHFVHPSKTGGFCCDDSCLAYKSAKVCSHTVAAAIKTDTLTSFVKWHKTLKSRPNFTVLAESGKPVGVGTKHKRKGISKKTSKQVHGFVSDASESDFTYRVCTTNSEESSSSADSSLREPSFLSTTSVSATSQPSLCSSKQPLATQVEAIRASEVSAINVGCSAIQVTRGPPPLVPVNYAQVITPLQVCNQIPANHLCIGSHMQQVLSPQPITQAVRERPPVVKPFWVCFIFGNISRCNGCKGKILRGEGRKPLPPPDDLVLRHREFIVFNNPRTGLFEQSKEERNVYYHPWKTCVVPHFSGFDAKIHIQVDASVRDRLLPTHHRHIMEEFGLSL